MVDFCVLNLLKQNPDTVRGINIVLKYFITSYTIVQKKSEKCPKTDDQKGPKMDPLKVKKKCQENGPK